uniref:Uncharacterized protein n=1 Tax=Sipha flava TaxID=143950 RepID=A0A2S2Q2H1_9HEMI
MYITTVCSIPMFVLIHGPLDNFSCFPYENYLYDIKKSIKSIKHHLQEIYNRIIEKQNVLYDELPFQLLSQSPTLSNEIKYNTSSLIFKTTDTLFEKIILPISNILINVLQEKDRNIILKDGRIVSVHHIVQPYKKPIQLFVKQFFNYSESTTQPLSSFKIGVYILNTSQISEMFHISLENIKFKCFFVRLSNESAFISTLCHTA